MKEETANKILAQLLELNKEIKEMRKDNDYQLRRIATRLEEMSK